MEVSCLASPAKLFIVRIASANNQSLAAGGVGTARLAQRDIANKLIEAWVTLAMGGARPTRRPPDVALSNPARVLSLAGTSTNKKATARVAFAVCGVSRGICAEYNTANLAGGNGRGSGRSHPDGRIAFRPLIVANRLGKLRANFKDGREAGPRSDRLP